MPESVRAGIYPVRIQGAPAGEETTSERWFVQAQTTLILGPILDAWNFIRRPLPGIFMTVVEPFDSRISAESVEMDLRQGSMATLELKTENIRRILTFR